MTRYEYKVIKISEYLSYEIESMLNQLAHDGWELVTASIDRVYLRKPLVRH